MNDEHAYYLSMQRLMKPVVEIAQDPDDNLEIGMMESQTKGSAQGDLMNILTENKMESIEKTNEDVEHEVGQTHSCIQHDDPECSVCQQSVVPRSPMICSHCFTVVHRLTCGGACRLRHPAFRTDCFQMHHCRQRGPYDEVHQGQQPRRDDERRDGDLLTQDDQSMSESSKIDTYMLDTEQMM